MFRVRSLFPTPVGVFLYFKLCQNCDRSLPHARGGVSIDLSQFCFIADSSPRRWGWFRDYGRDCYNDGLFPTPVGVFPKLKELD